MNAILTPQDKPFHKFRGWKLLALVIVALGYGYWFSVPGPFGQLAGLAPGMPLEASGYYTGTHAVEVLGSLDADGRKAKYLSLAFDLPYMVLNWLLAEALIAFGMRHMNLMRPKLRFLFALPLAYLVIDLLEGAALALTLATGSTLFGTMAGILTPLKMATIIPAFILAFVFGIGGLIAFCVRKLTDKKRP